MLRLTREVHDSIVPHAREGAPREVCGVLGGEHGDESHVEAIRRAENVADEPRARYELDPAEQLRLMEALEDEGHDVVGFYHSHPRGPEGPSATDAAQAHWAGYSYVVCSLAGEPTLGSWRWRGGDQGFEREDVRVE